MLEFYNRHSIAIKMWGIILALLGLGLLLAYCSASTDVRTDKADEFGRQSSNAHIESTVHESDANAISEQIETVAEDREDARNDYTKAKKKISKVKYEAIKNKPVVINPNDLDSRERKLLAKLRKQQG